MPTMVLARDYVLITTKGHGVRFTAGVPTHVPAAIASEAYAIGAQKLEDGDEVQSVVSSEMTQEERNDKIDQAILAIVARNDSSEFRGTGVPTQAAVSRRVGFVVSPTELEEAWKHYNEQVKAEKDKADAAQRAITKDKK